ncbi:unnamed protein product [Enterobius vermicularis]|uniref:Sulfatase domain-containing protein n=1 Tax=Enterobius vermicularis TaxID=51028 RepID=A0A0N4V664_ENTVE|nr:unnamed protein product [Enterobius vermicularis]
MIIPLILLQIAYTIDVCRTKGKNVVLILTDDQDIELGSMEFMPKTRNLLQVRGITFQSGFVSTPICCPSRSSILTGQYVHNHNVFTNNQNCSGASWREIYEKQTFGVYLQKKNYVTAYFGKYLNEYDGSYQPPGWNEWMGLVKNSRFYNYTVVLNGEKIKHGFDYERDYFTDLIANDTIAFLKKHCKRQPTKPFLVVLSFPAPHGPEDPAPQFSHLFENVETHRTPSWNYAPNPDKQWILQHTGRMEPVHVVFTDLLHRRRLQTLQSVDHNIQRLFNELRNVGVLSQTYIIYSSDHGYHLGQFGLVKGKNMPYEFDIRVPFFIRGPDTPRNITIREPVMNVDIAPTILDVAGIKAPPQMDGRSLLPLIKAYGARKARSLRKLRWRHTVLIERGKMTKLKNLRVRLEMQSNHVQENSMLYAHCKRPEFNGFCDEKQDSEYVLHLDEEKLRWNGTVAELYERSVKVLIDGRLRIRWRSEFLNYLHQVNYLNRKSELLETKTQCHVPQMNCFLHGTDHWRTPPLWPQEYGEFCFCQNANNNTYWCLRTVNETHNFLYCEFLTEFISYYDLITDPYQVSNLFVYFMHSNFFFFPCFLLHFKSKISK